MTPKADRAASTCIIKRSEVKQRYKQINSKRRSAYTAPFDLRRILELRRGIAFCQGKVQRKRKRKRRKRRARNLQKEQDRKEIDNLLDGIINMEIE